MLFEPFPKIARLKRGVCVTEKIDGTNAQVLVKPLADIAPFDDPPIIAQVGDFAIFAGSRSRYITPEKDNFGFARWVKEHAEELATLGAGRHFGEWWGNGIQRGYGLENGDKRFSLFNVSRWALHGTEAQPVNPVTMQDVLPACVGLVPRLYLGDFSTDAIDIELDRLSRDGSVAAPGFMKPEGVVVYHSQSGTLFKKTIDKDEQPKGREAA